LADFWSFNFELERRLGLRFDDTFFCPHRPEDRCICRKPSPYLLELALRKYPLDRLRTWVIGDSKRDIEAGAKANLKTALVLTGKTLRGEYETWSFKPTIVGSDLLEIANLIITEDRGRV